MKTKTIVLSIFVTLCLAGAGSAVYGGVPDPNMCSAASAGGALFICPAGDGETLAQAGAAITVTVLDSDGLPCAGYPKENIWVSSIVPGDLELCPDANMADTDTDSDGVTTISGTIVGGGYTQGGLYVYIDGLPVLGSPLDIDVNSTDMSGDLAVNLCEMIILHEDFGTYSYRSDLNHDSFVGFEDLMVHNLHGCHTCPGGWPGPNLQVSGEIGAYFDQAGTQTDIQGINPNIPFNFYIVAFDASDEIQGYQFKLGLDPNIQLLEEVTQPPGSTNYGSMGEVNAITGGICLPGYGPVVLVEYLAILTDEVADAAICLGPVSDGCPGTPGGSAYLTCLDDCGWRIFEPAYMGCAIVNGEGPIAATPSTWGALKTLYR